MCRRILSLVTIVCLTPFAAGSVYAKPDAKKIEKVKAGISKVGIGPDARVEVKLSDKTKLKGYVSDATAEYFVITNSITGESTTVQYARVSQVKGNNLSTGAKIAIGVGVVGFFVLFAFLMGDRVTDH